MTKITIKESEVELQLGKEEFLHLVEALRRLDSLTRGSQHHEEAVESFINESYAVLDDDYSRRWFGLKYKEERAIWERPTPIE